MCFSFSYLFIVRFNEILINMENKKQNKWLLVIIIYEIIFIFEYESEKRVLKVTVSARKEWEKNE